MPYKPKCVRLNLDWTIEWRDERSRWLQGYLDSISFKPTSEELDMMSKYILWGKNKSTGLNGRQEGLELDTSRGTWDSDKFESLEALIQSPTFSENLIRRPDDPIYKIPKQKFSRSQARKNAPPDLLRELEALWREIDYTELLIGYYDLAHNRRKTPIRDSLLNRIPESDRASIHSAATTLSSYTYLSYKHYLVELRRQQYMYKDSYSPTMLSQPTWQEHKTEPILWDVDVVVLPLGLKDDSPLSQVLFNSSRFPEPKDLDAKLEPELSALLWRKVDESLPVIDFRDPKTLNLMNTLYLELRESVENQERTASESNYKALLDTFDVYCALAPLKDFQRDLLNYKRHHYTNEKIVEALHTKYGHKYTVNYISTLYHQAILTSIADTARLHREVCENLFFAENFKTCLDCGRTLLKSTDNFMRKIKVKDGFDCRCKACAKILRDRRNGK